MIDRFFLRRWRIGRVLRDLDRHGPDKAVWPATVQARVAALSDASEVQAALAQLAFAERTLRRDTPDPADDLKARVLAAVRAEPAPVPEQRIAPWREWPLSGSLWRPGGAVTAAVLMGVSFAYAVPVGPTPEAEFLFLMSDLLRPTGVL